MPQDAPSRQKTSRQDKRRPRQTCYFADADSLPSLHGLSVCIRDRTNSNNRHAAAILYALQSQPLLTELHFKISCKATIRHLTTDLEDKEDTDWVDIENHRLLRAIVAALRGRGTKCTFQKMDIEHSTGMQKANTIAAQGLQDEPDDVLNVDIPQGYKVTGMKLSKGTQRTFYKALKARRKRPVREKTKQMLSRAREAATLLGGRTPTDAEIWKSLYHPDITRKTRDFLWRCMHQAYKVGTYWLNIPTYEHYAECQHCHVDDTLEHILLECDAPGREKMWSLAQQLWEMKGYSWPEVSLGGILACGFAGVHDASGKKDSGADRLFRILISETAHQIWKTRCTRVIDNGSNPEKYLSEHEIHNKWLACINERLRSDFILTDKLKFENRALNLKMVLNTWKNVLDGDTNLPAVSLRESRLLVGIAPLRPPGRNLDASQMLATVWSLAWSKRSSDINRITASSPSASFPHLLAESSSGMNADLSRIVETNVPPTESQAREMQAFLASGCKNLFRPPTIKMAESFHKYSDCDDLELAFPLLEEVSLTLNGDPFKKSIEKRLIKAGGSKGIFTFQREKEMPTS
ncbi:hypothetical protein FB45DRAFT_1001578 [Roridomyces roridus]|uniref:Reverse transcriptase zinc-binding domain-containing protein n=1 Tax=Roridomyces roridus TaxID=1738132 RepID=A0AAD7C329_9AGAR|nr:hypothetical protein FB45DRAFT_1001578 [Roridomyces roridus]